MVIVSEALNVPQNDVGNCLRLYISLAFEVRHLDDGGLEMRSFRCIT